MGRRSYRDYKVTQRMTKKEISNMRENSLGVPNFKEHIKFKKIAKFNNIKQ